MASINTGSRIDLPALPDRGNSHTNPAKKITFSGEHIMSERLDRIAETLRNASSRIGSHLGHQVSHTLPRFRGRIIAVSLLAFAAYGLYSKPPMQSIGRGEIVSMSLNG